MESLEDLRDYYKSSQKSNHVRVKTNGATYSLRYRDTLHKTGNNITKYEGQSTNATTDQLNRKYALNADNLPFSLNKKERWLMVDELKAHMDKFNMDDVDVRVYETRNRIKANKNNENMVGVTKSKGQQINIKSKYANRNSILHSENLADALKTKNNQLKTSEKEKTQEDDKKILIDIDEAKTKPYEGLHTQYNIEYPPDEDLLKYTALFEFNRKEPIANRKFTNVLGDEARIRSLKDACGDWNDQEDDEDDDETESYAILPKDTSITIAELLQVHAKQIVNRRKHDKIKNIKVSDEEIKKLVYVQRQNSYNSYKTTDDLTLVTSKTWHLVGLSNFGDPTRLNEKYGSVYMECFNTIPRICVFNLADNAESLNAWLIVSATDVDGLWDVTIKVTRSAVDVQLNTKAEWDFDELYRLVVAQNKQMADGASCDKPVGIQHKYPNYTDLKHISSEQECKEFDVLKNSILFDKPGPSNDDQDEDEDDDYTVVSLFDANTNPLVCSICFNEDLCETDCTILKTCLHSVCNKCWTYYIDSCMAETNADRCRKPCCPACDDELEIGLIVRFASDVNKLDRFIRLHVERTLFLAQTYKWCSSPTCQKLIKIDLATTTYGIGSCVCGHKFCLKCGLEPHFPAKCSQIRKYDTELRASGHGTTSQSADDEQLFSTVGCKCPVCLTFIEKNGGCNHMQCTMCKTSFCWRCLKTLDKHGDKECKPRSSDTRVVVEFINNRRQAKSSTKSKDKRKMFHEYSVEHREARSSKQSVKRATNINRIMNSIKPSELQAFNSQLDNMSETVDAMDLYGRCRLELQKRKELRQFLQKILSFLNELHFVCEYGYVLLAEQNGHRIDPLYRNNVFNILSNIEIIIAQIDNRLHNSTGMKTVDDLDDLMRKGLNCLSKMSSLTV